MSSTTLKRSLSAASATSNESEKRKKLSAAEHLYEYGYVIINEPIFTENVAAMRSQMEKAIQGFPEFKKHPTLAEVQKPIVQGQTARYSVGGTSFLGNPAVFHNLYSRELRQTLTYVLLQRVFKEYKETFLPQNYLFEACVDRILCRPAGDVPIKESWHRDESPSADPTDQIFGGWINLDPESQYFSCVPGSHFKEKTAATIGFHKLDKTDFPKYEAAKQIIEIRPGEILLVIQETIHEIINNAKSRRPYTSLRQFLGYRFTTRDQPLHGTAFVTDAITRQSAMKMRSDQYPCIYPKTAVMYPLQREKKELFLQEMTAAKVDARTRNFVSLAEQGATYPEYAPHEIQLLFPSSSKTLLDPYSRTIVTIDV